MSTYHTPPPPKALPQQLTPSTFHSAPCFTLQCVHVQQLPPRPAAFGQLSTPLSVTTQGALSALGVTSLFSHQAAAVEVLRGARGSQGGGRPQQQQQQGPRHCVIATSTASGKSLCYYIPLLEALADNPQVCICVEGGCYGCVPIVCKQGQ
jgi:DEAD/DEAH box helicase domain-containing protein